VGYAPSRSIPVNHTLTTGAYHVLEFQSNAAAFTAAQFNDFALASSGEPAGYVYQLSNNTSLKSIDLNVYNHSFGNFHQREQLAKHEHRRHGARIGHYHRHTINLGTFSLNAGSGTESLTLGHILANLGANVAGLELSSIARRRRQQCSPNIGYTPSLFTGASALAAGRSNLPGVYATGVRTASSRQLQQYLPR